jgi:ankyrin repeat protein
MRKLQSTEPLAVELTAIVKAGELDRLRELLASDPGIASCVIEDPKGSGRTPLHLFADWPGHNINAAAIVQTLASAGANLDAPAVAMWHRETPLHWAASNDDVMLVDALLDAGADIEHEGSSIDGGSPLSSAVGYGQWEAARRLVERGARTLLWHEAALGMLPAMMRRFEADPIPQAETLSGPFWNACHGGQLAAAQYLLERGADLNWPAPWSGQTPLDIAEHVGQSDAVTWLLEKGAIHGKKSG